MLYLTRKLGETVVINNNIEVTIVEIKGKTVKLGFTFPRTSTVLRKEIYDVILEQNLAASHVDSHDDLLQALFDFDSKQGSDK